MIVQGVLGGTRVTQVSTFLAAVHGCTGQAFFGLMVALCVLTGRDWLGAGPPADDPRHLRRAATVMLALVYGQIVLGAWLRHYGTIDALVVHVPGRGRRLVPCRSSLFGRVERNKAGASPLVPSARFLAFAATLQVALGLVSFVSLLPFDGLPHPVGFYQAVIRTGHQTNGALLLAASVVLALRAYRHLRPLASDPVESSLHTNASGPGSVPADLEVVA